MDKLAQKTIKPPIGDISNPEGLYRQMLHYLEHCLVNGFSQTTVDHREESLRRFLRWCDDRDIQTPQSVNLDVIERYKFHLYHHRKRNDKPLAATTQRHLLSVVRAFFRYLAKQKKILFNPAAEIDLPKEQFRLPRDILSPSEIELVLKQPKLNTAFGLRDRAILELLYSTGIRRLECVNLLLRDLNRSSETLFISQGKGGKDRLIPVGQRALKWINRYLDEVRPCHIFGKQTDALFITQYGKPLSASFLSDQVTRYLKKAQLDREGSCHLFRHSMATHMLDNGADIRYIQAMLGHADISTTEVYTHVSIGQLKKVHQETHPAQAQS